MNFSLFVRLKYLAVKGDVQAIAEIGKHTSSDFDRSVCDALCGVRFFELGNNISAQRLFAGVYGRHRSKLGAPDAYLKLYCLVYLKLLQRSLDSAAVHAQQACSVRGAFLLKRLLPVPELEDKVLFQNTIELSQ